MAMDARKAPITKVVDFMMLEELRSERGTERLRGWMKEVYFGSSIQV
jgi:hypothetical protein